MSRKYFKLSILQRYKIMQNQKSKSLSLDCPAKHKFTHRQN